MTWFRQEAVAEMMKELDSLPYSRLLQEMNERKDIASPVNSWADWFDRWGSYSPEEKTLLLHHIFAVCRRTFGSEWWNILFLMFVHELHGLFHYYRARVRSPDERWSVIVWAFMEEIGKVVGGRDDMVAIDCICGRVKQAVNRTIHRENLARRTEQQLSDRDLRAWYDNAENDERQDECRFLQLCQRTAYFLSTLSATDRAIAEEIYILGRSKAACAKRLGLSRHQIDRRTARIRTDIALRTQPPLSKGINIH